MTIFQAAVEAPRLHAEAAEVLVDARDGVKKQTRRHAAILDLLGDIRILGQELLRVVATLTKAGFSIGEEGT